MHASRKAYGYSLSFASPWVIDILGKLDFDYVFIDGEHGPFGLDQLEDLCRTAERYNVTPIARVPDIGSSTILRNLDRGIMGILGPHIATEVDARELVRACYFGPLGERSFGANRGTDYNAGMADKAAYYREANEQMLVCALLEDVAVLDDLDAILSCRGSICTASGQTISPKAWAIPASPTIRKLSTQCRKLPGAFDRPGGRCSLTSCKARGSAICCSMRVVVFYRRSIGERVRWLPY
jgi:HpcH/HpaI aldolase/citrate lyase family